VRSLVQLQFHLLYVVFYLNYSLEQHSNLLPRLCRYLIANLVVKRQPGIELPGECLIPRPEHILHISVRQVAVSIGVKSLHQQFRLGLGQMHVEKCKSLESIVQCDVSVCFVSIGYEDAESLDWVEVVAVED
jgi:hypothetical protein